MKAVRLHEHGGPDALRVEDVPAPEPGPGEALVRIEAAGVNFIDVYQRTGLYATPLPMTPGQEAAGVVEAVGEGVDDVAPGDRVAYTGPLGAYAEQAVVPAWRLVPVPDGVSTRQAAAVMLQGMTAQYLATSTFSLEPGSRALIHAAAGGVGLLLVQLAKAAGAWVVGTAGTDEKAAFAREAGADHVIVYTRDDFAKETRRLTGGEGVDVVYDSVGKSTFEQGLDLLKLRGTMVLFGQSSGPVGPLDPRVLNQKGSLYLTRPSLGHYTATRLELLARAADVLGRVAEGSLDVHVYREYPLEDASRAHDDLESRRTTGKLILVP